MMCRNSRLARQHLTVQPSPLWGRAKAAPSCAGNAERFVVEVGRAVRGRGAVRVVASGQADFCAGRGLGLGSLHHWLYRLQWERRESGALQASCPFVVSPSMPTTGASASKLDWRAC